MLCGVYLRRHQFSRKCNFQNITKKQCYKPCDPETWDEAERSHSITKSMKTSRRFTQINRVLRFGSGVALISAAAAMAFVAVKPSSPSLSTSQELQWTEDGKMSAAF